MVAIAVLLALAELTSWWAVAALPAAVAVMVKFNDLVAGTVSRDGWVSPATSPRQVDTQVDAHPADLHAEVTPAFRVPGGVVAGLGTRSSRIYVSGSHASAGEASAARSGTRGPAVTVRAPHGNQRFDETTQHSGLERHVTGDTRSAGRPDASRGRQQSVDSEAERAAIVRPEWRQTVTLGPHIRRDDGRAGNRRQAGADRDGNEGRHQGGQPNRQRFV
jgi:hypothetical protein